MPGIVKHSSFAIRHKANTTSSMDISQSLVKENCPCDLTKQGSGVSSHSFPFYEQHLSRALAESAQLFVGNHSEILDQTYL
jgi:hypothetical protein